MSPVIDAWAQGPETTPAASSYPAASHLSGYGLSADPFKPLPLPRRALPAAPSAPPPVTADEPAPTSSPMDIAAAIRALGSVVEDDGALDRIEAAIRKLPSAPTPSGHIETRLPDGTIMNYAAPTKFDQSFFARLRGPEGTLSNYDAVNPVTGAGGPYQFLPSTWRDLMASHPELGLTLAGFNNPSENQEQHEKAIRAYTDRSIKALSFLGRQPTAGELYALHLFGQAGGSNFLKALDSNVADVIPSSFVDANPWLRQYTKGPGRALLQRFEDMMRSK